MKNSRLISVLTVFLFALSSLVVLPTLSEAQATPAIVITSPQNGQQFGPGQTMTIAGYSTLYPNTQVIIQFFAPGTGAVIYRIITSTNANGNFSYSFVWPSNASLGMWKIQVEISVASATVNVLFTYPTVPIHVTILNSQNGLPIGNAIVNATNENTMTYQLNVTNSLGKTTVYVPVNTSQTTKVEVSAQATGFVSNSTTITLSPGQTSGSAVIYLTPNILSVNIIGVGDMGMPVQFYKTISSTSTTVFTTLNQSTVGYVILQTVVAGKAVTNATVQAQGAKVINLGGGEYNVSFNVTQTGTDYTNGITVQVTYGGTQYSLFVVYSAIVNEQAVIQKIQEQVANLTNVVNKLSLELTTLNNQIETLNQTVNKVQGTASQVSTLSSEIQTLNTELSNLTSTTNTLNNRVNTLSSELGTIQGLSIVAIILAILAIIIAIVAVVSSRRVLKKMSP